MANEDVLKFNDFPKDIQQKLKKLADITREDLSQIMKTFNRKLRYDKEIKECQSMQEKIRMASGKVTASFLKKKEEAEKEKPVKHQTTVVTEDGLFEQVQGMQYVGLQDGEVVKKQKVETEGVIYKPLDLDRLGTVDVKLPKWPKDYGSKEELLEDIKAHIENPDYLQGLSERFIDICAMYPMITWVTDRLDVICYLKVYGDTGAGKSRWKKVVGDLCYKPISSGGATTPAPIYRTLDILENGTFLFDEMALRDSDLKSDIAQILNSGYEKGNPILRCVGKDDIPYGFPTFGPKLIASRQKSFLDEATEKRCFKEKMKKKQHVKTQLPDKYYEEVKILRNKLLMFRLKNWNKTKRTTIDEIGIDKEKIDVDVRNKFASLVAVFYDVKNVVNRIKRYLEIENEKFEQQMSDSSHGDIVKAIYSFRERAETDLDVGIVIESGGSWFINVTAGDIADELDYINPQKVGRILSNELHLNRKVKQAHAKGEAEKKSRKIIKMDENWEEAKRRYLTDEFKKQFERVEPKPVGAEESGPEEADLGEELEY